MEIYLVRHTKVDIEPGICYGVSDVGVVSTFRDEVENVRAKLPFAGRVVVFSSELKRCKLLATEIFGGEIIYSSLLDEFNYGEWEMKKWSEIDSASLNEYINNFATFKVPGGDTFEQLNNRVQEFWKELVLQDFERVVIVTHSGVISAFLANYLELPIEKAGYFRPEYGSVSKLTYKREYRFVDYINK